MISTYPESKIKVRCDKCGLKVQYDRQAMLDAGGDRRLTDLLDEIVLRSGCTKQSNIDIYDRCYAVYANIRGSE